MKFIRVKHLYFLSIVGLLFGLGYIRDFFFLNLNAQVWNARVGINEYPVHQAIQFLEEFDYNTLVALKWIFTGVFASAFALVSAAVIHFTFKRKEFTFLTIGVYMLITVFGGAMYSMATYVGHSEQGYLVARNLMGLAQSPFLLMVLYIAFLMGNKQSEST